MSLKTSAAVEIAAPPAEVFRWITEVDKLTTWMGGAGAMPADSSQLKVGFTAQGTMPAPEGQRATTLTVTAWDPPASFGCTIAYPGGDSIALYTLAATPTGTRLELTGDTDWASMDRSALDREMDKQSQAVQDLVDDQVEAMMARFTSGAFDSGTQAAMQKSVEDSLAKLKILIESA